MGLALVVAIGAAGVGALTLSGGDEKAGRPLLDPDLSAVVGASSTTRATSPATTTSVSPTTTEAIPVATLPAATTTTAVATLRPFPTSAPSCELADMDPDLNPNEWFSNCIGAFGFARYSAAQTGRFFEIYRWTGTEWQSRGSFAAYCTSDLTPSGMPNDYAKDLAFPGTTHAECYNISLRPEPSSGTLSFNDEGPRVKQLQLRLRGLNLLFDTADGEYGPNTFAAVVDLQFLFGLEPTGEADREVLTLLGM